MTQQPKMVAGFWIRFLADFLDVVFLGLVGFVLSIPFAGLFQRLGSHGAWIGLVISFAYAGLLQSRFGQGRSVGKHLLKLQVVRMDGGFMSLPTSLLRYGVICLLSYGGAIGGAVAAAVPFMNNRVSEGVYAAFLLFLALGCVVLVPIHPLKRGIHDLIAGTLVVYRGTYDAQRVAALDALGQRRARMTLPIIGALSLVMLVWSLLGWPGGERLVTMDRLSGEVSRATSLRGVSMRYNVMHFVGPGVDRVTRVMYVNGGADEPLDAERQARQAAEAVLRSYPERADLDAVIVKVSQGGYDIGIYRSTRSFVWRYDNQGRSLGVNSLPFLR